MTWLLYVSVGLFGAGAGQFVRLGLVAWLARLDSGE